MEVKDLNLIFALYILVILYIRSFLILADLFWLFGSIISVGWKNHSLTPSV